MALYPLLLAAAALVATVVLPTDAIMYQYVALNKTYFEARAYCECNQMELARVDQPEQNQLIQSVIPRRAWIAGNILAKMPIGKSPKREGWIWDGHGPIKPECYNFAAIQPDNLHNQEYCIQMQLDGMWNDLNCAWKCGFVCQYDG